MHVGRQIAQILEIFAEHVEISDRFAVIPEQFRDIAKKLEIVPIDLRRAHPDDIEPSRMFHDARERWGIGSEELRIGTVWNSHHIAEAKPVAGVIGNRLRHADRQVAVGGERLEVGDVLPDFTICFLPDNPGEFRNAVELKHDRRRSDHPTSRGGDPFCIARSAELHSVIEEIDRAQRRETGQPLLRSRSNGGAGVLAAMIKQDLMSHGGGLVEKLANVREPS